MKYQNFIKHKPLISEELTNTTTYVCYMYKKYICYTLFSTQKKEEK